MNEERLRETWQRLGALVISRFDFKKTGLKSAVILPSDQVQEAARALLEAGFFLETITAVEVREGILVTYLYDSLTEPGRLAVRVLAEIGGSLPSVASLFQGAEWHEREASDFLGVEFSGNPNPVPLLLPHDYPGPPPLLRTPCENIASVPWERSMHRWVGLHKIPGCKSVAAPLSELKIFGQAEFLDPAWRNMAEPQGQRQGEAAS
jgi:NADH-quinone oxidoreductase subunit C